MARRRRARNLTTATEVGLFKNVDLEQAAVAAAKKAEAAVLKAALAVAKKAEAAVRGGALLSKSALKKRASRDKDGSFTCKACNSPYKDESGGGSGTKYNCGFCSNTCRVARQPHPKCDHGRDKSKCKDCGTGYCQHGRRKKNCKDCGTGHCQHGRQKHQCKEC
jgi:hypothetical protein